MPLTRFLAIITIPVFLTCSLLLLPLQGGSTPCVTTSFQSEMIKQACWKGGQNAAKDAMKAFMKEKKIKSCSQCHTKLAPKYERKKDAFEQYKNLGGK